MAESIVESVVKWIGSLLIQEASILWSVKDEVESLQQKLQYLQEYLRDADANPGEEVRALTVQVRKLAYDAEDLIDTFILQVNPRTQLSNRNFIVKSTRKVFKAPYAYTLGKRLQVVQDDVREVLDKLNKKEIKRTSHETGIVNSVQKLHRASYPYNESEYVVGWEKDVQKLVQVLMGQGSDQEVRVVSIMGMGGSGKTTLARTLYNHPYVKECFDCWAWVYISEEWSPEQVLYEILRQIIGPGGQQEIKSSASKEELVDKLRSVLEKKSYLVVLDDVWRRQALEDLFHAFPHGHGNHTKGSKIIITTRNLEITRFEMPQFSYVYEPPPLDEDQGWQLLSKLALTRHVQSVDSKRLDMASFEHLGKEMLRQCNGLPLAIVTLAGILSTKSSIMEWQEVRNAVRTRVMYGTCSHMSDRVGELLALSYDDLPYYLKPCFLYLGLFPEDCQIPAGMLTRMWAAEGLVTSHGNMSVEDVAMQRLEELSHRFMIQVAKTNFKKEIKAIRLHDLLRDLCVTKAKEQGFLGIYPPKELTDGSSSVTTVQPRRAALYPSTSLPTPDSPLRALVLLTRSSVSHSVYESKEMIDLGVIHSDFKLLRVLNLWGIKTANGTLPKHIGKLIHLRYLGIRASNVIELPTSIGDLRNLLTLDYRNVDVINDVRAVKIPNVLFKLLLLRHLFLPIDSPWNVDKLKLSTLRNLQTLWGVKQEGGGQWLSEELLMLSTSLKKLKIVVSTEKDLDTVFGCPSLMSTELHTFHCELRDGVVLRLKEPIVDLQHLHKLALRGELQTRLSHLLPCNLIQLELNDSLLKEDPMMVIGRLAHLKLLKLSNAYIGFIFICPPDSFPQLEELYLENLLNVDTWVIEKSAMPSLKKLEILWCMKLCHLPIGLPYVTTLQQLHYFGMPKEFCQEAAEYGWSKKRLRLPNNCDAILEQCDCPVDTSSVSKLYEQLTSGVFLNGKKKRYWVIKHDDRYYNCFMLYAKDFNLQGQGDMNDNLLLDRPPWVPNVDRCWDWELIKDSSIGEILDVGKVKSYHYGFEVPGNFSTEYLSPQVTYEVAFVIMLPKSTSENKSHLRPASSMLNLPNRCSLKQDFELNDMPRKKWIHLPIGKFETSPENIGEMTFSLRSISAGVMIKGVNIQPKF